MARGISTPNIDSGPDSFHRIDVNEIAETIDDTALNSSVPLLV